MSGLLVFRLGLKLIAEFNVIKIMIFRMLGFFIGVSFVFLGYSTAQLENYGAIAVLKGVGYCFVSIVFFRYAITGQQDFFLHRWSKKK